MDDRILATVMTGAHQPIERALALLERHAVDLCRRDIGERIYPLTRRA